MDKKTFCLEQIKEYYLDRSKCAYDGSACQYLTPDGKMCVLGKNLIDPGKFGVKNADELIVEYGEGELKPEARGILTPEEWYYLQNLHDSIAIKGEVDVAQLDGLNLFTLQQLKDYANS